MIHTIDTHNNNALSLHIELHYLDRSRVRSRVRSISSTDPHLHIISSRGGEVFKKPWRGVEGTAGVGRTTPLSIPERVRRLQSTRNSTEVYTEGMQCHKSSHFRQNLEYGMILLDSVQGLCRDILKPSLFVVSSDAPAKVQMCLRGF